MRNQSDDHARARRSMWPCVFFVGACSAGPHDTGQGPAATPIEVRLTGGDMLLAGVAVASHLDLRQRLASEHRTDPKRPLQVQADQGVRFGRIRQVLRDGQQAGIGDASVQVTGRGP